MRRSSSNGAGHTAARAWVLLLALLLAACSGGPDQSRVVEGLTVGIRTDPSPAELGELGFTFFVKADGKPVSDATVAFRMYMPGMPMSSDDVWIPAYPEGRGRYAARGDFSMGGTWTAEVAVSPPGRDPVTVPFPFEIKWELR